MQLDKYYYLVWRMDDTFKTLSFFTKEGALRFQAELEDNGINSVITMSESMAKPRRPSRSRKKSKTNRKR